jgi:hypothetical protein
MGGRAEQPQQGVHGKGGVPLLLPEPSGLDGVAVRTQAGETAKPEQVSPEINELAA